MTRTITSRYMYGMLKSGLLGLFALLISLPALAQIENAVSWKTTVQPQEGATVGDEVTVVFEADIDPGFHIYSAVPPPDWPSLATIFELDESAKGVEVVGDLKETGHPETAYDSIFETKITIFHDKVSFRQTLKITEGNPNIASFVRYQICDAKRCIPGTIDANFALKTVAKSAPVEAKATGEKPDIAPTTVKIADSPQDEEPTPQIAKVSNEPLVTVSTDAKPETVTPSVPIEDAVEWTQRFNPDTKPRKGDIITLRFDAKIAEGFHIYASTLPEKPANLPTAFILDETSKDVELIEGLEEEGEVVKKYDEIFETDVYTMEGEAAFIQKIKITGSHPKIEGFLDYQVCDISRCIPDKVEVAESWDGSGTSAIKTSQTGSGSSDNSSEPSQKSLWVLILQALALGFGSVLTPCVFPLIPLTVSFFTKQSKNRGAGIRNATFYGLSIVSIYTILGLLVAVIFGPDAMRQLSVSPGFNIALFALIFVFALSFLGMFEITLPSSWSTALSKGSDRGGIIGIFLMALTLAIVSFSCTGPLVFTALAEASNGEFIRPIVAMLAFSGALALPFVFFAIFPAFINSLPKSGGWLNSVKVVLGFLEMALALIYLSRADLVMHWGILDREIFIGSWIVIFSMLGIYLLGKLQLPHDSPVDRVSVPRLLMAMSSFWFVMYLVPGLWGAPLNMLGGYIPESNDEMGVLLLSGQTVESSGGSQTANFAGNDICTYPNKISEHLSEGTPKGFCAFYDLEQGMEYARQVNKPVFLDFTGHTCANCRYLEKNAWIDPEVKRYIRDEFVLISLYTDDRAKLPEVEVLPSGKKLRTVGDKWIQYEQEMYNQNAQPYYVLLDHDNSNLIPPTGYNPPLDVQEYRDFFKKGLEEFKKRRSL